MGRIPTIRRAHMGRYKLSPEKEPVLEVVVARGLGMMRKLLVDGKIDEKYIGNAADETHFRVNMENERTTGFEGSKYIKYAYVVICGEGMTMVLRLSGGRNAGIEKPFMVFLNKDIKYPICGVLETVPGVAYRTGPRLDSHQCNFTVHIRTKGI